ncbi:MAG TPA: protein kinase, partial [Thermoanaerobaculia bacterium]|nr:protein kinase [Thermoanaerobaculia bacterium]
MRFEAGTTLAHYEILSLLGRGGMGEVYRASDGKLGREVAIKVLPEDFTRDEERLARFEREARVLASLDHPHVASIHGIEHLDGVRFLVMQLARGEDLSKRLVRGPLPLEEAISVATQVAEALEAAHGQGIIHRDLKPANIRIDEEGKIKVLDFGLAKALEGDETEEEISNSPTMIRAATHAGVILGTAAYMSPEQARGKRVDRRADIWAFGVVLWEMLTGKRLFSGDTVSDTLAAVLRADVDLNQLPFETPRAIRDLIRRCLTRDPRNRLHDIADARIVLQDVDPEDRPGASGTPLRSRGTVGWIAALISAVAVAAVLLFLLLSRGAEPREPQHFALHLSGDQSLMMGGNSLLTFSPDGKSLIFSGAQEGKGRVLFRRDLGQRQAVAIAGTDQGESPFISPDGRWLGFVARGKMMKIPSEGGRPFALADARGAGGAAWLSDDTIVFAPIYSDGLFRISAEGGTPERLTTPDRAYGELGHWWPEALPGESRIVFTAFRTPIDRSRIGVVDLKTGQVHWVVEGGFFGRYVSTGHLVYAKGERLYAIPFDPKTATAQGAAVAVLDDLKVSQSGGFAMLAVSPKGTLAYVSSTLGNPLTELVWIDRTGKTTPALPERKRFLSASLSPDGNHAAVTIEAASRDLWIYSFDRGTLSRQTSGDATEFD